MKKISIEVDGMQCSMCEKHVNEAIKEKFFVKDVKSSNTEKLTTIITDKDLPVEKLKNTIEEAGYSVGSIKEEIYEKKGILGFLKKI
ncbi:heavy-metal-associated domain-containing protein [Peptostreptococcus equinus]|uniref:Heavy metal-associated domain-containing protein n=1 Tax=Peptostreptococcus equinus TaxID=3003601 RepID=A0ABY7JNL3_9FIRM|nr:heavy metal-associated domain-containing protein [Peptostreptococcus sp. CBA3647]WAW14964.1 heavy metal-associated domain-containing protein [Peptostreptococcus sp. CBA3647]